MIPVALQELVHDLMGHDALVEAGLTEECDLVAFVPLPHDARLPRNDDDVAQDPDPEPTEDPDVEYDENEEFDEDENFEND